MPRAHSFTVDEHIDLHSDNTESRHELETEFFLIRWFKDQTLIKVGGILFFLGSVWFVSYAVSLGWISPALRISFGFALALGFFVLGWYRARIVPSQFVLFTALGTGILLATTSAAQVFFGLLPTTLALMLVAGGIVYALYVAYKTQTTWFLILLAVTALCVPYLIAITELPLWTASYLLVVTISVLFVGLKLEVRPVALLLALGVFAYAETIRSLMSDNTLWFFVVLYSVLFFASVTLSLVQSAKPHALDITTLIVVACSFLYFADTIALQATVATFIATLVISITGYLLSTYRAPAAVVAVYAAFACAGLLVSTSFLFSGFSLALAYIVEVTAAFLLVTYLGLPERVIYISALAYLLALFSSLPSFFSTAWEYGIGHADAIVVYLMASSLVLSALWLVHNSRLSVYAWSRTLAKIFSTVGFCYLLAVIGMVTHALFAAPENVVMMYLLWSLLSLSGVYYALYQNLSRFTLYAYATSVTLPFLVSFESFSTTSWSHGFKHPDGYGVLGMLVILTLITLLLIQKYFQEFVSTLKTLIGSFIIAIIGYLFVLYPVLWGGVLVTNTAADVITYVSYAVTLYALTSLMVMVRAPLLWIVVSLGAFGLPVLLSLESFTFTGWSAGFFALEGIGLFTLLALFIMMALGLRQHFTAHTRAESQTIQRWTLALYSLAFVYAVGLVWSVTHSVVTATQAISIALFVYTVSGLVLYQYGKRVNASLYRYAGSALLVIVVLRLLLIDAWNMEMLWRFITFLGIGALFIGIALLEREREQS